MGCWHSLWGACLRVPARPMLFLTFSAFSQRFGQHSCDKAARGIPQVEVCFLCLTNVPFHCQPCEQERAFTLVQPRTRTATLQGSRGGLIHMVFYEAPRGHHCYRQSKNGSHRGSCRPEVQHETPASPCKITQQSATKLISTLLQRARCCKEVLRQP